MAINKIVYGDQVLVDLSGDTITPDKVLTVYTFHGKDGEPGNGTCDYDVNSQDATVAVAEMLKDKTAYARGAKLVGTMPNIGAVSSEITTKDGTYSIPMGFHDGAGKVKIAQTEQDKLIPANIRDGVTILGVEGTMSGNENLKAQAKTVTPTTSQQVVLPDEAYTHLSQVTVNAIPYVESDNSAGGKTVKIG